MSANKKPRADSVLKTLPRERQSVIAEHMRNHTIDETHAWLKDDGLKTSRTALSEFFCWYALQQQLSRNETTVEALLADLSESNPEWSPDQIQQAGQSFFTALALQQQDPKQWLMAQSLAIKREQLSLDSRKVALMEKKAAAFDQAKAVVQSQLTPEEQNARLKEILK